MKTEWPGHAVADMQSSAGDPGEMEESSCRGTDLQCVQPGFKGKTWIRSRRSRVGEGSIARLRSSALAGNTETPKDIFKFGRMPCFLSGGHTRKAWPILRWTDGEQV